jgi:hypothetical protein
MINAEDIYKLHYSSMHFSYITSITEQIWEIGMPSGVNFV